MTTVLQLRTAARVPGSALLVWGLQQNTAGALQAETCLFSPAHAGEAHLSAAFARAAWMLPLMCFLFVFLPYCRVN